MKYYNRGPVKNKVDSRCPGACIISLCISCDLRFVYRGVYITVRGNGLLVSIIYIKYRSRTQQLLS